MATRPPSRRALRRLDLVAISDRLASLILVMREGALKQVLVTLDEPADQGALTAVANRLNELLDDLTAGEAERVVAMLDAGDPGLALHRRVGERVVRALREFDAAAARSCSAMACRWPRRVRSQRSCAGVRALGTAPTSRR
jgi:transcriptional regulator of heat shock response